MSVIQGEGQQLDCFCEIAEATGAALTSCQTDVTPTGDGWCYVDASANPASSPVVAKCPASAKRELRFIGDAASAPGSSIFLACP
jgi:hypothetical protein